MPSPPTLTDTLTATITTLTRITANLTLIVHTLDSRNDQTRREELVTLLLRIHDYTQRLETIRAHALEPTPPTPQPCQNPHCPDHADADKAGRCSACYQYRRRTGRDRQPQQ